MSIKKLSEATYSAASRSLAIVILLGLGAAPLTAADSATSTVTSDDDTTSVETKTVSDVTIETEPEGGVPHREVPWLGVSTAEASEALASQLDLEPGVGLVVTYVAPQSPAAAAGLRKNDLLIQFDGQSLVHPAQLRKLVHVRKEGEEVKLAFYRAGKLQKVSATLGKTKAETSMLDDQERALKGNLKELHKQLRDLHLDAAVRDQMKILGESLGNIKIDQKQVQEDIRHGMEQARIAIQEALKNVTNSDGSFNPVRKILEGLAHSGVVVDDRADVVVRSSGKNVRSTVKSDESGTIVLVNNPKLHLTAHDKEGKLLFDGPIETEEERSKVPAEVWQRVEPLLDQMKANAEESEPKDKP